MQELLIVDLAAFFKSAIGGDAIFQDLLQVRFAPVLLGKLLVSCAESSGNDGQVERGLLCGEFHGFVFPAKRG